MSTEPKQDGAFESFGRDVVEIRYYDHDTVRPGCAYGVRPTMRVVRLNPKMYPLGDDVGVYGVCVPGMPYIEVDGWENAKAVALKLLADKREKDQAEFDAEFRGAAGGVADMEMWRTPQPLGHSRHTLVDRQPVKLELELAPMQPVQDEPADPRVPMRHWKTIEKRTDISPMRLEYISIYYSAETQKVSASVYEDHDTHLWYAFKADGSDLGIFLDHESAKRAVEKSCA